MSGQSKKRDVFNRVLISVLAILLIPVGVVYKALDLQINEKEKWTALEKKRTTRLKEVPTNRGSVFADDNMVLAISVPRYNIAFDPNAPGISEEEFYEKIDSLSFLLAKNFGKRTEKDWKKYIVGRRNRARGNHYVALLRNINYGQLEDVKRFPFLRDGKIDGGLIIESTNKRELPFGKLAKRTVGIHRDANPVGLEGFFDSILAGKTGKRLERRISGGKWLPIEGGEKIEPKSGLDIKTTIDVNLQDVTHIALERALKTHGAHHGCAVLMEVKTGAIKSVSNLTRVGDGSYHEIRNYFVSEAADPGSTFKLATFLALIEDGFIDLDDSIDIEFGKTQFHDAVMVDASVEPDQFLTTKEVFARSSNVGTAKLAQKYYASNPEKFVDRIRALGLNERMGIEIKGEGDPRIKSSKDKDWTGVTLPWMSIGYEMKMTPIQILTFYNAIANNGDMIKPYLVDGVYNTGKQVWKYKPSYIRENICSERTLKMLHEILLNVVEKGTARRLKTEHYLIAGKTGTSQILTKGKYDKNSHKATFVGYFPADKPIYTCLVQISKPTSGVYYGASLAGPVFREISDRAYSSRLDVHRDYVTKSKNRTLPYVKNGSYENIKSVLNNLGISSKLQVDSTANWVSTKTNQYSIKLIQKNTESKVPNLKGYGLKSALALANKKGYKVKSSGYGKVTSQVVFQGSKIIYIKLK